MARRGASELAVLKEAEDEATRIIAAARDGALLTKCCLLRGCWALSAQLCAAMCLGSIFSSQVAGAAARHLARLFPSAFPRLQSARCACARRLLRLRPRWRSTARCAQRGCTVPRLRCVHGGEAEARNNAIQGRRDRALQTASVCHPFRVWRPLLRVNPPPPPPPHAHLRRRQRWSACDA